MKSNIVIWKSLSLGFSKRKAEDVCRVHSEEVILGKGCGGTEETNREGRWANPECINDRTLLCTQARVRSSRAHLNMVYSRLKEWSICSRVG